jgi:hypothetical protein
LLYPANDGTNIPSLKQLLVSQGLNSQLSNLQAVLFTYTLGDFTVNWIKVSSLEKKINFFLIKYLIYSYSVRKSTKNSKSSFKAHQLSGEKHFSAMFTLASLQIAQKCINEDRKSICRNG